MLSVILQSKQELVTLWATHSHKDLKCIMNDFSNSLYAMYNSIKDTLGLLFFNLCIGQDRQNTNSVIQCAQAEKEVLDSFPIVLSTIASLFILNRLFFSKSSKAPDRDLAKRFIDDYGTSEKLQCLSTDELCAFLKGADHRDSLLGRVCDFFDRTTWRHSDKYYQGRACDNTYQFNTISEVSSELGRRLKPRFQ